MERNNTHAMHESLDVFDDEFAVDEFDVVADGFAPGRLHMDGNDGIDDSEDDEPYIHSVAAHMADPTTPLASRFAGNRNSMRKSRNMENPFRSVEDGDDTESLSGRPLSIRSQSTAYAPGNYHRSLSSTSSRAFAPSRSPSQSASGPSHPYAMYPQGTNLARTPSVSTVSTIRAPQRPLMADQGPTHPYAMYPQNVSEDTDEDQNPSTSNVQSQIPVGFPGRQQPSYRRQGPEGEEHDIIGVDGHTEQLPPYSEYPEDGVPKHIVLPQAAAVAPTSGTQLNLPLFQGRPQSMSDAGARAASPREAFAGMQQMESNDSTLSGPKRWRDKSWKEKRKTKVCGIPFWWLLLSMCVLAFIAIVLGGAIGGFMTSQKREQQRHSQERLPSSTNLYDASPIPTSSSGSPPPTGTYALSLGAAQATQAACLVNQTYSAAWDCDIPGPQSLAISIQEPPSSSGGSEGAALFDTSDFDDYHNFSYGTQTPSTSFSQFIAVSDNDDPDRGPAYYFQAYYDKLVIVGEYSFPSSAENQKRTDGWYVDPSWGSRKQIAAGEKPWFCYWNGTMLEGFIYTNNYTGTASSSSHASITSSATQTPSPTSSSSYFTTTVSGVSTTATLTAASATSASPAAYTNTNSQKTGSGSLPGFGYVVKIEERRVQNSMAPYCQQMQILDDGTAGLVSDASGNPIRFTLAESDPSSSAYQSASSSNSKRSDTVPGGCHCQWWSGSN